MKYDNPYTGISPKRTASTKINMSQNVCVCVCVYRPPNCRNSSGTNVHFLQIVTEQSAWYTHTVYSV